MPKIKHWGFIGLTETEINNKGMLNNDAKRVFVRGQCHSLALAIREITGWPLYGLVDREDGNTSTSPSHVVVRTPNGAYIDVNGPGAVKRWRKQYPRTKLCRMYPSRIKQGLGNYLPLDVSAARPFAKAVLELHCRRYLK